MRGADITGRVIIATKGTRLAWMNGQPFLFVPGRQALCGFAPDAADLWAALEQGLVLGPDEMPPVVSDLIDVGAVDVLASGEGEAPVAVIETLALGRVRILVTFPDEAMHAATMPAFAHLRAPSGSTDAQIVMLRHKRRAGAAERGGPVSWGRADQATPLLKIALTDVALDHVGGLALHAATVLRGDRALLLLGEPGAGKSTLSLALHGSGFAMLGDDLADLGSDGRVQALPFAVTLKRGSWRLFQDRHGDVDRVETFVRPDGKKARYLPIDAAAGHEPRDVGWIVLLDRREGHVPEISEVPVSEVFAALLASAWSGKTDLSPSGFAGLAACIDGARCIRLSYSDLDAATGALARFCGDEGA